MTRILCGIDIGGTKMASGLLTPDGTLGHIRTTVDHACMDEACLMDLAAAEVAMLCKEAGVAVADLEGVAVGMAGHMRSRDGIVVTTSNLTGFKHYPLASELSQRLGGIRVILENDANCQAWAEYKYGAGKGHDDMVFVTVSTGIGAGIVINGRLYRGRSGTAGEIGHTIIEPSSDSVCTCGNKGCFMAHACTLNLEHLARKKSVRIKNTRVFENPADIGEKTRPTSQRLLDGKRIYVHAREGDPVAIEIIHEYADYLGIMLYNLFQILNPSAIILGGGLMNWELGFFERMTDKFHRLAGTMLDEPMLIEKAGVGEWSGVIGAGALLLE